MALHHIEGFEGPQQPDEEPEAPPPVVRPFWGRVAVQPLDTEERAGVRPSGLLVYMTTAATGPRRGAVVSVDEEMLYSGAYQQIQPGTVVYFNGGLELHGVIIIDAHQIVAYEVEP